MWSIDVSYRISCKEMKYVGTVCHEGKLFSAMLYRHGEVDRKRDKNKACMHNVCIHVSVYLYVVF